MKRIFHLTALILAMSLVLASCGKNTPPAKHEEDTSASVSSEQTTTAAAETTTTTTTEAPAGTEGGTNTTTEPEKNPYYEEETSAPAAELEYWTDGSGVAQSIRDWVAEVTDPASDKYIPPEDRIVVSDLDGTLIGELCPSYFDWCMFVDRVLYDDSYTAPQEMIDFAKEIEATYPSRRLPKGSEKTHAQYASQVYAGMTIDEYCQYVRDYMQTEAVGFTNLTKGDAFYKPMVSLIDYLHANDFVIYIVSGSGRYCVRELVKHAFPYIPSDRVLGTDITIIAEAQGDTDGFDYVYAPDDKLVLGNTLITKNVKMNKVSLIAQEIGKYPVLSLGNSSGDISMAQYTLQNPNYEGRAYMLLCDDTEREYGKPDVAESFKASCDERGFITVSMRDDFATIYGDDVTITETGDAQELAPAA